MLDRLIHAASVARDSADDGNLFVSTDGAALINAMFDLTECDALYDLYRDVMFEAEKPLTNTDYRSDLAREAA